MPGDQHEDKEYLLNKCAHAKKQINSRWTKQARINQRLSLIIIPMFNQSLESMIESEIALTSWIMKRYPFLNHRELGARI